MPKANPLSLRHLAVSAYYKAERERNERDKAEQERRLDEYRPIALRRLQQALVTCLGIELPQDWHTHVCWHMGDPNSAGSIGRDWPEELCWPIYKPDPELSLVAVLEDYPGDGTYLIASTPCPHRGCDEEIVSVPIYTLEDLGAFLDGNEHSAHRHRFGD